MVLDAVSNFVRGNTDAAVGTSDTTVSVDDASIFPDPATDGDFNVVIWDVANFPRPDQDGDVEIMRVTAQDTTADELTVTRAQEMTSAAAHPEGSAIHLSPTAKMFSDIESTFGDFWDAETQELTADVNNTNTTTTSLEAEDASTKVQNDRIRFNDRYDTLQDAIDETPSAGSVFVTENPGEENITTDGEISIIAFGRASSALAIGDVTINGNRSDIIGLSYSGEIIVDANICNLENLRDFGDGITIKGDFAQVRGCFLADITFESGTEGGFAYANPNSTVTDNGNNEILSGG